MPPAASPGPFGPLVEGLESAAALDAPGKKIGKFVRGAIPQGTVKDALSGTWLGHALHPLLTDVVIASFLSSTLLDVLGGDDDGSAAERLITVGLVAYGPTALTGVNDWADSEPVDDSVRRVGLVHAGTNAVAFNLYAASLRARRRGDRGRGKLLALAGAGALTAGGFLGGHLVFAKGVGPQQTAYDPGPDDWTAVDAGDLQENEPKAVTVDDTPVFLLRHRGHVHALHDRCSHRGCSLADGQLDGEVIECQCHGSRFRLKDGSVERGPAFAPQPVYEVRETDGRIELRLPQSG
jgi:nitrite reductase/ring-hydroxylating ferredoxin subunit